MCEIRGGSADSLLLFFGRAVQSFENGCRLASHLLRAENKITQKCLRRISFFNIELLSAGVLPHLPLPHLPLPIHTALCPEVCIPQNDNAYLKKFPSVVRLW